MSFILERWVLHSSQRFCPICSHVCIILQWERSSWLANGLVLICELCLIVSEQALVTVLCGKPAVQCLCRVLTTLPSLSLCSVRTTGLDTRLPQNTEYPLKFWGMPCKLITRQCMLMVMRLLATLPPKMLEEALGVDLRCEGFENWKYSIQNIDGSSVIRHHGIDIKRTEVVQNVDDLLL